MAETVAIGSVYQEHPELVDALKNLFRQEPQRVQVPGLAGPNELVQVLGDIGWWKLTAATVLSIYGSGIVSEAGKDTWRTVIAPKLKAAPKEIGAAFQKLVDALAGESARGNTVGIGLIEPTFDAHMRSDRVYITDFSPEEVARVLVLFGNCAEVIGEWMAEEHRRAQAEERSPVLRLEVSGTNTLVAVFQAYNYPFDAPITRREYSTEGVLLSEERTAS